MLCIIRGKYRVRHQYCPPPTSKISNPQKYSKFWVIFGGWKFLKWGGEGNTAVALCMVFCQWLESSIFTVHIFTDVFEYVYTFIFFYYNRLFRIFLEKKSSRKSWFYFGILESTLIFTFRVGIFCGKGFPNLLLLIFWNLNRDWISFEFNQIYRSWWSWNVGDIGFWINK